ECALLDLAARLRGLPLHAMLAELDADADAGDADDGTGAAGSASVVERSVGTGSASVAVNGVIGMGSPEESAEEARRLVAEGYGCVKMKVGGAALEEDVARVRAVRMAVPEELLLRLDANGAWDFAMAEEALREFALYDIEYIEQPVAARATDELAALTAVGIMAVAADESAQDLTVARALLARGGADIFVIKPMAAGGLVDARRFAREAAAAGCDVVFTSLVDSAIGRSAVAQLCASLPTMRRYHGLATGDFFLEDTAPEMISRGRFMLVAAPGIGVDPEWESP
ncbi:MAG: o-succinylbenzoate synthase, partial [Bacteroidetes bacterium]|nr:o-succinylbenzoate synthase [Bacteroidota bacterium]